MKISFLPKIIHYYFFFFLLTISCIRSQNTQLDSLYRDLKKTKQDTSKAAIRISLSQLLYLSNPDTVILLSNEVLEICNKGLLNANSAEKRTFLKLKASAINNLGYLYDNKGQYKMALDHYQKALILQKNIGDFQGEAQTYNNIGFLYQSLNNIPLSLSYLEKSLALREKHKLKSGIAESLNNIGFVYRKFGDPNCGSQIKDVCFKQGLSKALDHYLRSLQIYQDLKSNNGIGIAYNNIGTVYNYLKDYDKAQEYFEKSLDLRKKAGDKKGEGISLTNLSGIYFGKKNYKYAQKYGEEALRIAKEIGFPDNIKRAADLLFKVYKTSGNSDKALEMYRLYIVMRDSLDNHAFKRDLENMQLKIEYANKHATDSIRAEERKKVYALELKHKKTQSNYLISGLVLLSLLVLFVFNRFKITQKQKILIEKQKELVDVKNHIIEEKQKEIIDSINYAKRIQYTLLAHEDFLKANLSNHFVYFKPKDIVSGDFYWATKKAGKFYLAVCDSTGHGVPGAFMSLLNIGFLSEAINEKGIERPNEVLNFVRQRLIDNISKEGQQDGFDGILICIEAPENENSKIKISYAAANNSPVLINNGVIVELEADRMPVGMGEKKQDFTYRNFDISAGDSIYLYTDGFADQFGGPESHRGGKKFKYKNLNELILKIHNQPMSAQKDSLSQSFDSWKGELEQVDDICIIGIRF